MNVAIIDKHPVFRTGVRVTIEGSFGEVTTFETAKIKSLRKDLGQQAFDFIIIGISEDQPDIDRRALKTAMKNNPNTSFIVYAYEAGREMVRSLVRMGTRGVLFRNGLPQDLVDCLQSILAKEHYLCPRAWSAVLRKTKVPSD